MSSKSNTLRVSLGRPARGGTYLLLGLLCLTEMKRPVVAERVKALPAVAFVRIRLMASPATRVRAASATRGVTIRDCLADLVSLEAMHREYLEESVGRRGGLWGPGGGRLHGCSSDTMATCTGSTPTSR